MIADLLTGLKLQNKVTEKKQFAVYCLALAFILLIESVASFYYPIILEETTGSSLSTGLVIGIANVIALVSDLIFPELFKKKTWKFLFLAAVILQLGFPGFTILSLVFSTSFLLIIAAVFWNIYYEFLAFSRHNYIVSNEKKEDYSKDWGMISVIGGVTAVIGPVLGSQLLSASITQVGVTFGVMHLLAFVTAGFLILTSPKAKQAHRLEHSRHVRWSILKEFKLWELLGFRILPVLILGVMLALFSSSVLTVGGLLGQKLFGEQNLEWLLIFAINLPSIIISLILSRITVPKFKKMLSQFSLILSGMPLLALPFIESSPWAVLIAFFISSLFNCVAWIFNEAVYSDLSERSGEKKLYINSMERINDAIGFLVGPILIGVLADKMGYFVAFEVVGALSILAGVILLFITPKKILIPQQELAELDG